MRGGDAKTPAMLRLFPLKTVLFPGAVLAVRVFEPRYRQMVGDALRSGEGFGVVLIRDGDEAGDPDVVPHAIGTTAEIDDVTVLDGGRYALNATGRRRFRIDRIVSREPYSLAEATFLTDDVADAAARVRLDEIRDVFREYLGLLIAFSGVRAELDLPEDPLDASYLIGDALQVADAMKQQLLELRSAEERLGVELGFLRALLPRLRALLERTTDADEEPEEPAEPARATQERLFGSYFSRN